MLLQHGPVPPRQPHTCAAQMRWGGGGRTRIFPPVPGLSQGTPALALPLRQGHVLWSQPRAVGLWLRKYLFFLKESDLWPAPGVSTFLQPGQSSAPMKAGPEVRGMLAEPPPTQLLFVPGACRVTS